MTDAKMKRAAQILAAGAGVGAMVFILAAVFAAPNVASAGNVQDAWRCFWAGGACGVLAVMLAIWSIDA